MTSPTELVGASELVTPRWSNSFVRLATGIRCTSSGGVVAVAVVVSTGFSLSVTLSTATGETVSEIADWLEVCCRLASVGSVAGLGPADVVEIVSGSLGGRCSDSVGATGSELLEAGSR